MSNKSAEITVIIKDDDKTYKQNFLHYDDTDGVISLSHQDARLKSLVEEATSNFKGNPDERIVKISYVW